MSADTAVAPERKKTSFWEAVKTAIDVTSGIAVPVILFYIAQQFEAQHERTTAADQQITHSIEAVKYLASPKPEDFAIGAQIVQLMDTKEIGLPKAVQDLLDSARRSNAAAPAATSQARQVQEIAQQTVRDVIARLPRVFVHVPSEEMKRKLADEIAAIGHLTLRGSAVTVPEVRIVDPKNFPSGNELRFSKRSDTADADLLLEKLQAIVGPLKLRSQVEKFDASTNVLPRTYELWIRAQS